MGRILIAVRVDRVFDGTAALPVYAKDRKLSKASEKGSIAKK
jgi:hypothetical protein